MTRSRIPELGRPFGLDAPPLPRGRRAFLLAVVSLAYLVVLREAHHQWGHVATALGVIPVAAAGWLFGSYAGLVAGLLTFPVHATLFNIIEDGAWSWAVAIVDGNWIYQIIMPLVGYVAGRTRDLRRQAADAFNLLETTTDGFVAVDHRQRIVAFNQRAEQLFGYSAEEIIGEHLGVLLPPRFRAPHVRQAHDYLQKGESLRAVGSDVVVWGVRRDGEEFPCELTLGTTVVSDRRAAIAMIRDISDRVKAEAELRASEETFRALFDHAPIAMAVTDLDGGLMRVNHNLREMFDFKFQDHDILSIYDLVQPDDRQKLEAACEHLVTEGPGDVRLELRFVGQGGHVIDAVLSMSLIRNTEGELQSLVVQIVDISRLREATREMERLLEAKDRFIASISHELRTPLTAVVGFAQVLRENSDLTPTDREELISFIARQSIDLSNIIEDLLVVAWSEDHPLQVVRVPVDLRAQIAQVLEVWDEASLEGIEVSGSGVRAIGDPGRVRQIIRNLVSNALRYGEKPIRIQVSRIGSLAQILVCDQGAGLPEEEWERIFEPFYRSHDVIPSTGLPGVGLGLHVSRQLTRLMEGDLKYYHEGGESVFEFTLPLSNEG